METPCEFGSNSVRHSLYTPLIGIANGQNASCFKPASTSPRQPCARWGWSSGLGSAADCPRAGQWARQWGSSSARASSCSSPSPHRTGRPGQSRLSLGHYLSLACLCCSVRAAQPAISGRFDATRPLRERSALPQALHGSCGRPGWSLPRQRSSFRSCPIRSDRHHFILFRVGGGREGQRPRTRSPATWDGLALVTIDRRRDGQRHARASDKLVGAAVRQRGRPPRSGPRAQPVVARLRALAIFGILTTVLNSLVRERESLEVPRSRCASWRAVLHAESRRGAVRGALWLTAQATSTGLVAATLIAAYRVKRSGGRP